MKKENEGRAQLQVVDTEKGLPDTAAQSTDKGSEIWKVATTLDEERWKIRDKIGDLYQRALTRLLGSSIVFALGVLAADDDWKVPLLGNTLRTVDVAEQLRVSTTEAERMLEDMRRRSLVTTDVDATGMTLYLFPNRR